MPRDWIERNRSDEYFTIDCDESEASSKADDADNDKSTNSDINEE